MATGVNKQALPRIVQMWDAAIFVPFADDFYEYSGVSGSFVQVEHGYSFPRETTSNTYNFECVYCHNLYFDPPSECRGCGSQRFYDLSRRPLRDIVQRQ